MDQCPTGKRDRPRFGRNLVRNFPISGSVELRESYRISIAGFTRELKALLRMPKIFPHPTGIRGGRGEDISFDRKYMSITCGCGFVLNAWKIRTPRAANLLQRNKLFILANMAIKIQLSLYATNLSIQYKNINKSSLSLKINYGTTIPFVNSKLF